MPEHPPLFLFGHERSGTTLLSMIVGAHPRIAVPLATTGMWYAFGEKLEAFDGLATRDGLERAVDALLANERIQLWDVEFQRSAILDDLPTGDYAALIARFHTLYAKQKGKSIWGNIDIATLDKMDVAARWFPSARFIHIVRDARDVALSNQSMPYSVGNMLECARKWNLRLYSNLKMGAILGPERYLVVHYEDLVTDPMNALREMCAFIGVDYSDDMLNYPDMVDGKIPDNRRFLWPDLNQSLQTSKVGRWKKEISLNNRLIVEDMAGGTMAELGYEVMASPPKRLSAELLAVWYFLARGGRITRLMARLGLKRKSRLEQEWAKSKRSE